MPVFCISKYDPQFRKHGKYIADEWTDYSDIGSPFNGKILTREDYLLAENNYIQCITDLLILSGISSLCISNLEIYEDCIWAEGQVVTVKEVDAVIRDWLRNVCWCKLECDDVYIHFGYDYYVYVRALSENEFVKEICNKYHLFAEKILASPYESIH